MSETTTTNYPNAIIEDLEKLEGLRHRTLELAPVAEVAEQVVAALPKLDCEVSIVRQILHSACVCIRCDVAVFNDGLPLFHELAKHGWHVDKDNPFDDMHEIKRRTYNLQTPDEDTKGKWLYPYRLKVMLFIRDSDAKCRRVQIGVVASRLEPGRLGQPPRPGADDN